MILVSSKALLDWQNTPADGVGTSLAQRLMGRRCRTLLPVTTVGDERTLTKYKTVETHQPR